MRKRTLDGSAGWDAYAPFYDWENARTFGRRDVPFWRSVLQREGADVLELGCGTGRLLAPLSRGGARLTGLDRSPAMLARARVRLRRLPRRLRPRLAQGDVRQMPFRHGAFDVVLAPYGMLQSLLDDRDLDRALAEAARVVRKGGLLGAELVPELPDWAAHGPRSRMRGRRAGGATLTLVESVVQQPRRGLTIFHEQFVETRAGRRRRHRFSLTFRTRPMPQLLEVLGRAGFRPEVLCGDYQGGPWHAGAETWLILARKL